MLGYLGQGNTLLVVFYGVGSSVVNALSSWLEVEHMMVLVGYNALKMVEASNNSWKKLERHQNLRQEQKGPSCHAGIFLRLFLGTIPFQSVSNEFVFL